MNADEQGPSRRSILGRLVLGGLAASVVLPGVPPAAAAATRSDGSWQSFFPNVEGDGWRLADGFAEGQYRQTAGLLGFQVKVKFGPMSKFGIGPLHILLPISGFGEPATFATRFQHAGHIYHGWSEVHLNRLEVFQPSFVWSPSDEFSVVGSLHI